MSNAAKIHETIAHYESFINDTMKENLKDLEIKLQNINTEIMEFTQIKKSLGLLKENTFNCGFKTQVDVGCNFFIEAKVEDPSVVMFNIGLHHYLEFTHDEAIKYSEARVEALEAMAEIIKEKSALTKAHIKLLLFGIGELQNVKVNPELPIN